MVKKSIVFIVFLTFSIGAFCSSFFDSDSSILGVEKKDFFHMDMMPEFGIVNGTIGEYVFEDACSNTDHMLSRLDWDVVTVPYASLSISFDLFRYFYIGLNGTIGIPVPSGVMEDYDWLNSCPPSGYGSWADDDPTELTNYSKHNNKVEKYYNLSAKLGGNIPIFDNFTITPYFGYKYDFIEMDASGGYTKYKWNDFQEEAIEKDKLISYAQELNMFILGLQFDFTGIPRLPIFLDFSCVPGLGKMIALDIHYGRPYLGGEATAFLDIMAPLFLIDGKLSCFFEANKHNRIGFSSFIQYMPLTKGLNGIGPVKNGKIPATFHGNPTGKGGASRFLFGFSIGYQLKL